MPHGSTISVCGNTGQLINTTLDRTVNRSSDVELKMMEETLQRWRKFIATPRHFRISTIGISNGKIICLLQQSSDTIFLDQFRTGIWM